jgi:hypothetical protein
MAGWTALACCQGGGEGEQLDQLEQLEQLGQLEQQLYDNTGDAASADNKNPPAGDEERMEVGPGGGLVKSKRTTNYQLSRLFPTLFTPRAYYPAPKGGSPRVQAKPVFSYDPYYLVRI